MVEKIMEELNFKQTKPTKIFCDNKSAISSSKNPVLHERGTHINMNYHYIGELVSNNDMQLEKFAKKKVN